jgi:serine/threonine-protein kinase
VEESLRAAIRGEFDIAGELGHGGMAAVYLAHDIALDKKVAIKVMAPTLMADPTMVERFMQEARLVARLEHPNIVTVHAAKKAGGLHFFVMKYVEGRELESVLQQSGALPLHVVQALLHEVGSALQYAHEHGVVHRDVKPSNIMIDVRGNAVVTDFGIAKLKGGKGLTVHGAAIGTPQYMSPEQCLSQEIGPASDQYSLGIVAYHMLSGQPPFAGAPLAVMRSQVDDNPPPLRMLRDEPCPQEVRDALDRMLAKDPESRFPKVIEAVRVMRGHPLGPDDPVRQELAQLVKRPDFIPPTAVFTTPMSPSPSVAPSAPPAPPTPPPSAPAPEGAPPSVTSPPGAAEPLSGRMGQAPPAPTAPVSPAASVMPPATPVPETMALAGPPTLRISGVPRAIKTGESVRLRARLIEPSGSEAIPSEVVWTSSNPSVAVVDSDGRVHALAVGTASIRGAAEGLSVAADVTVQGLRRLRWPLGAAASAGVVVVATAIFLLWPRPAPKPMTVAIQPASLTLGVGQEATFVIPGMPEGESVVWSSSAPAVATVDAVGRAYGMATGTALIVARVGSVADTATVTVESLPRYVAAIRLSPSDAEVLVGQEVRLAAVALDSSGVPVGGSAITWRSENEARATVSADGRVRGLAPGSVRVLAASAGIEAAAEISVVAPRRAEPPRVRVATVEIRPPEVALRTGETQTLVATPLDGRGTRLSRPVTWQRRTAREGVPGRR